MTHEELLKRIEILIADFCEGEYCAICAPYKALRAVVELHKPNDDYKGFCSGCYEEESGFSDYPCPTIKAIETALNNV